MSKNGQAQAESVYTESIIVKSEVKVNTYTCRAAKFEISSKI